MLGLGFVQKGELVRSGPESLEAHSEGLNFVL